ncbi:thiamine ABC transporter substrate binding subunit [Pectobacteriaceae bacterium CE70]|nr:thiamine ABC transporter substrate binding subunit [Pectobacteriaceae bacterium C52]WJV66268.1 thiamine ABC transporter substrate binding subunit [Pectobacteriaceae bacterium CE70]WJY10275.1 thiamine ABC transporter substrate binding subunit [Pectobacteriaceae bacterium C80]WJY15670.1 thiamine ABC transporter substrate binding subunit [Pectobacteriaceae bacterium CE90]
MLKKLLSCLLLISAPVFAKPTLTVYTYDSFASEWGPGPAVKKAFEKKCDCELKFVVLEDGVSLLNRLRMEGKHTKADIVLGLDNNLVQSAAQTGLFRQSDVDTHALTVPGGWKNTTFIPYDYGYFAFVYNKDTLKNPPKSLHELIDSPRPWKVIYQDPRTSTPGLGLLLWMQKVYGDQAPQAWKKLAAKTVTVTKGWSEAYGLFLKGEADLVLSYTTSPAYHIIEEKKTNYAAANFSEGHYLQVEVAGQLASSKHPQLATRFMQFMLTPAFQQIIPTTNWMYPVIKTELPAGYNALTIPAHTLEFTPQQVAQQRNNWIQAWLRAVSH